jgi:hypothetical protein
VEGLTGMPVSGQGVAGPRCRRALAASCPRTTTADAPHAAPDAPRARCCAACSAPRARASLGCCCRWTRPILMTALGSPFQRQRSAGWRASASTRRCLCRKRRMQRCVGAFVAEAPCACAQQRR